MEERTIRVSCENRQISVLWKGTISVSWKKRPLVCHGKKGQLVCHGKGPIIVSWKKGPLVWHAKWTINVS